MPGAGACHALATHCAQAAAPSSGLEAWLARLYSEAALRERFLADPRSVLDAAVHPATRRGLPALNEAERRALARLDQPGLVLHARSIAAKRRQRPDRTRPRLRDRLRAGWQRLWAAPAAAAGTSASGSTRAADPC